MAEQQYDHITQHVYNRIARNQVRRHQRSQQAAFWTAQRAFEASNVAAKCQDSRAASQDKQGRRQGKDRAQSSCKADVHHNGQETDVNGASPKFTAEDARLGLDEDAMDEDEVLRSMTEDSGIYNGQTSPSPAQPTSQCTSHERNREREQEQERADAVRQMREVLDRQQAQRAAEERLRETAWSADQEEGVSSVDINGDHIMGEGSLDPAGTFSSNFKRHINKLRQSEVRKAAARRAQQKQWEEEQRREQEEQQRREQEEQQRREREEQQRREQEEQQHWEREEQQRREQEEQQRREREEQQHREWEQQQQREREQQQRREWERERERQEYASMTPLERLRHQFRAYEEKWDKLQLQARATSNTGQRPDLVFTDIPWPVFNPVPIASEFTEDRIREFVLHEERIVMKGGDKTRILKSELLRWYPDKFRILVPHLAPAEIPKVRECADVVGRILTDINRNRY